MPSKMWRPGHGVGRDTRAAETRMQSRSLAVVKELLTTLYRPVGQREFELIKDTGFREFPPRLPEQPIFYPVLNEEYATQIARDWNTKDERSEFAGYVLKFQVRSDFLQRYDVHVAGAKVHQEYWIPAADLTEFNENIVGTIEVVAEFRRTPQCKRTN